MHDAVHTRQMLVGQNRNSGETYIICLVTVLTDEIENAAHVLPVSVNTVITNEACRWASRPARGHPTADMRSSHNFHRARVHQTCARRGEKSQVATYAGIIKTRCPWASVGSAGGLGGRSTPPTVIDARSSLLVIFSCTLGGLGLWCWAVWGAWGGDRLRCNIPPSSSCCVSV